MNEKSRKKVSKFLSLVLRHKPEKIGITLDEAGFVDVADLLTAISIHLEGDKLTIGQLREVVSTNDKQRFEFDQSGLRIRARQGHSVDVDHGLSPTEPPAELIHGTATHVLEKIRLGGLKKMNRHHVHLHAEVGVAKDVGGRHGTPVLLNIRSGEMHRDGFEFFVTANDVWLTDRVPPKYIDFPEE